MDDILHASNKFGKNFFYQNIFIGGYTKILSKR